MSYLIKTNLLILVSFSLLTGCGAVEGFKMLGSMASTAVKGPPAYISADHGPHSKLPTNIVFLPDAISSETDFKAWIDDNLNADLQRIEDLTSTDDQQHIRYRQLYRGIPVQSATYTAHFDAGSIWMASGLLYDDIDVNTSPRITSLEAAKIVVEQYPDWIPEAEPELRILPDHSAKETAFHLVYAIPIFNRSTSKKVNVYIDARKSDILHVESRSNRFTVAPATTETTAIHGRWLNWGPTLPGSMRRAICCSAIRPINRSPDWIL